MKCSRCGKEALPSDSGIKLGKNKYFCASCIEELENAPDRCPVCQQKENSEDCVALLLTKATASPQERLNANTALVHICPNCHVLYFDGFQYELIKARQTT